MSLQATRCHKKINILCKQLFLLTAGVVIAHQSIKKAIFIFNIEKKMHIFEKHNLIQKKNTLNTSTLNEVTFNNKNCDILAMKWSHNP